MKILLENILEKYKNKDIFYQKKSLYTLYFTFFMSFYTIIGGITESILEISGIGETICYMVVLVAIIFILKFGFLEITVNLLTFVGLLWGFILMTGKMSNINFYIYVMFCILVISVIYIRKYQLYCTISIFATMIVIKLYELEASIRYNQDYAAGLVQIVYIILGYVIFIFMTQFLIRVINEEISKSRNLEEINIKLLIANEHKTNFMIGVSHELKTPLNGIMGITEILMMKNENIKKEMGNVLNLSRHLLYLINNVLYFSEIENGKVDILNINFSLREMMKEVAIECENDVRNSNLEILDFISDKICDKILGDKLKTKESLVKLVKTMAEDTPVGIISIYVEKIGSSSGTVKIKFTLKDTGNGNIEKEYKSLTDVSINNIGKHAIENGKKGIEVAIAISNLSILGGQIQLESKKGEGNKIWFEIELNTFEEMLDTIVSDKDVLVLVKEKEKSSFISKVYSDHNIGCLYAEDIEDFDGIMEEIEISKTIFIVSEEYEKCLRNRLMKIESSGGKVYILVNKLEENNLNFSAIELTQKDLKSIFKFEKNTELSYTNSAQKIKFKGIKALIVEDNRINTEILVEYLKTFDMEYDCAESGEECLTKLQNNIYNVIFMDIQLPHKDGLEVFEEVKERFKTRPVVIACTANVLKNFKEKCLNSGIDGFISKPYVIADIASVLKKFFISSISDKSLDEIVIIEKLKKIMIVEYPYEVKKLKKMVEIGDYENSARIAHKLKSGAAQIQNEKMFIILKNIEEYSDVYKKEIVMKLIAELEYEIIEAVSITT